MQIKDRMYDAFHSDHADLGKALFSLREQFASCDFAGARKTCEQLDQDAGAHIAFEEHDFYPMLKPFLSKDEVETMYLEHSDGLKLIQDVQAATDDELADPLVAASMMLRIEALQEHVSDCGDLFGAMGGLSAQQYEHLYDRLMQWRKRAPKWSDVARPAILKAAQ